jgi:hypothetical protein
VLAAALLGGCQPSGPEPPAATAAGSEAVGEGEGPRSQAERTREMEAQAAAMEERAREARENAESMTEEEKIRAFNEFEAERQRLNEMGQGGEPEPPADDPQ